MAAGRVPSLRRRLLWLLLAAIVVTAVVQAAVAYRTARSEADEIFDYHMQQMALSLRSGWPVDGHKTTSPAHGEHDEDGFDFLVQVWSTDGQQVFRSAPAALPQRAVLGFSNLRVSGSTYRVFSMAARGQVIQVAQDMAARQEMAGTLALRTAAPIVVMAPLLMLVVWWVVGSSLAPVSRARRQVADRRADDLTPIGEEALPAEVRPLVHEINLLFERVGRAFDAQQRFVADAAHELRSPLAALKLQAQGLRRASDEASRERAVSRLAAGIDRAGRLVEQLLTLARQQADLSGGAAPGPVRLDELVRSAVADAAVAAMPRQVDVGVAHTEVACIAGHADALRILLRNLIDNAVKHAADGGVVDVSVRCEGDIVSLAVEDNGPGIPDEEVPRVFDRFYRVPGTATTGSGLGLAIVKVVADLHAATLSVGRSERLGGARVQACFARSR